MAVILLGYESYRYMRYTIVGLTLKHLDCLMGREPHDLRSHPPSDQHFLLFVLSPDLSFHHPQKLVSLLIAGWMVQVDTSEWDPVDPPMAFVGEEVLVQVPARRLQESWQVQQSVPRLVMHVHYSGWTQEVWELR